MQDSRRIEVVYECSCRSVAEQTVRWLIESGIAKPIRMPQRSESTFVCCSLIALQRIAADSVIVFVSDEATANADWQSYIRAVPPGARVLPVGGIEDVDYNDEAVLPKRIEEINFIRTDAHMTENILDSLTTDPAFYSLKNQLLLRYNCWTASGSKADLLSDRRKIQEYSVIVSERLAEERDKYLRQQLQNILELLHASRQYMRTVRRKAVIRWIGRGVLILAAIAMLAVLAYAAVNFRRADYASIALSVDADIGDSVVMSIKMMEAITNPTTSAVSKQVAYKKLHGLMNKPWHQTPIGVNYKYAINDAAIPDGSRYIWTGDSSGRVARWDTYTGRIVMKKTISSAGIARVAVSADERTLTALDLNGSIYTGDGKKYKQIGSTNGISAADAMLVVSGDKILLYDQHTIVLIDPSGQHTLDTGTDQIAVLCTGFMPDGSVLAAGALNETFVTVSFTADGVRSGIQRYDDIRPGGSDSAVMLQDVLAVCDVSGQVWKIAEREAKRTGLMLEKMIDMELVNTSTLVYLERNMGVGLYDIDASFDYGDVLSDVNGGVNTIWASAHLLAVQIGTALGNICLDDVLSVPKSAAADVQTVYDQTTAHTDLCNTDGLGLKSAGINADGTITLEMILPDADEPAAVLLNPAFRFSDGGDLSAAKNIKQYPSEPFSLHGVPTVVGIRFDPVNELSNTAGYTLLVGSADGSFAQVWFNPKDGSNICIGLQTIPSRCAVRAIRETGSGYLIEDEGRRLWSCTNDANLMTTEGLYAAVRTKLHSAVNEDLKEIVSKTIWRKLGLQLFPGGDGKEWD
ncbi:MAG: WD40 repeat domain-containing protein [Clostridia bacterium]|nr:WD40 repeat domain-containing protein [Clostridia bacterium]